MARELSIPAVHQRVPDRLGRGVPQHWMINTVQTSHPARGNKVSVRGRAATAKVPPRLRAAKGRKEESRSPQWERKPRAGRRAATPARVDGHHPDRRPCRPGTGSRTNPSTSAVRAPRRFTCCLDAAAVARSPSQSES